MLYQTALKRIAVTGQVLMALTLTLAACAQEAASQSGEIHGTVFTAEHAPDRTFVPGALVRIQSDNPERTARSVTTDQIGNFSAAALAPGRYQITVELTGMRAVPLDVEVLPGKVREVEIEMTLASMKEEVTVSANVEAIDTTETESKATLQRTTLEHAPNISDRVDGLLPLLPGVVRGPDGLINMKGARTSQNGVLLNGANVTDPVTGNSGINLPVDVVSNAQVVANPYDPEYGKLAGAVESIQTRMPESDKFHLKLQNFLVRPRDRGGSIVGIESATPRVTVTGPLIRDRVAITQSLEYRYVRTPVETLPPLRRDMGLESVDSYTQLDFKLSERQSASATIAFFPQKLSHLGLNTFTPQPATPDFRQRGHFLSFSHKAVSQSGALLASQIGYKTLDADVKPASNELYQAGVETTTGGFYNRQHRETGRFEWQEVLSPHTVSQWGIHQPKLGFDFARSSYDGWQSFNPVEILRDSGLPAERITYSTAPALSVRQREFTIFGMDKWNIRPGVTIDAGLRLDRDSISDKEHVAPRVGFAITPFSQTRTVIRGGAGYFYDRINLNIPTFTLLPESAVTRYSADGFAGMTSVYHHRLAGPIDNPRSIAWNVQIEHQATANLTLRTGFSQRNTVRDYVLQPMGEGPAGVLQLSNGGRSRYREFEVTARYQIRQQVVNASYVRSSAIGDLNDFNQFYGNTPNPVIRADERGPQPFDAPNRYLFWGQFQAPFKITISPVWDIHTGFPYSVVNDERDYVGRRNRAGRFPLFSSTDLQATKEITLRFGHKKRKAQAGIRVFNILNHNNPRELQANIASYRYGTFMNSVDRMLRGKFVVEF